MSVVRGTNHKPFLKWPGGKRWMSSLVSEVIKPELSGQYIEPFLGGGSVFLQLHPRRSLLSDANADLVAFLKIVRRDPEGVVEATWRLSNTRECYYRTRNSRPRTDIGWAARFLFLNRTCWGGIHRLNQKGEFNVPFGNSGRTICSKNHVVKAAGRFRTAKLRAQDFEVSYKAGASGDVIYSDPPYTSRGQYNGFVRYNERLFSWADQIRLAKESKSARRRGVFVVVSGVLHRDILSLYKHWWFVSLERRSLVARDPDRRLAFHEILLFSRRPKGGIGEHRIQRVTDDVIAEIPNHH